MLGALLDLVLPRSCSGCGTAGVLLCRDCRALLDAPALGPVRPSPCPPGLPPVRALARYDGAVQRMLLAHKEHGRLGLSAPLGSALARVVSGFGAPQLAGVVLCPAPSSRAAVRTRGYDHTGRLARVVAAELGQPVAVRHLLVPSRRVQDQAGLTSGQRARNLDGALRTRPGPPARVLVLDDVVTTGATLVEATRALLAAGHEVVGAAVLGATARRSTARTSPGRGESLHRRPDGG